LRQSTQARRLLRALIYSTYLASSVAAAVYFLFWTSFVRELREHPPPSAELLPPSHVDLDTMRRVGSLHPRKASSFVHFSPEKAPGSIRMCAFGDSFTYGDEVGDELDYPTRLQALFRDKGGENVEVINFGNSWHGFHQAYILWDALGRRFACDFVLLGPASFQPDRDTTFNHTDLRWPYYFHARFVLEDGDVRLVDVLGSNHEERFSNYYRFLPRWRYLRWDRNPPAVLQSMLPRGRRLTNPFYYRWTTRRTEAFETYRILLDRLADAGVQVVLTHVDEGLVELARGLGRRALLALDAHRELHFPYRAPVGHNSAWGNDLIARQYYAILTGDPAPRLPVLRTRPPVKGDVEPIDASERAPLSSFERIRVEFGDRPAGHFVVASREPSARGSGSESALKDAGVVSLLAILGGEGGLLEACFVPLDFELEAGAEVTLRARGGLFGEERLLGRVQLIDPSLNIGTVKIDGMSFSLRWQETLLFEGNDPARAGKWGRHASVLVGGVPALEGSPRGDRLELKPLHGEFRRIRAGQEHFVPLDELASSGDVNLVFEDRERVVRRLRVAEWEKTWLAIPAPDVPPQTLLAMTPGGAVMKRGGEALSSRMR
jgi:hypothetical protein